MATMLIVDDDRSTVLALQDHLTRLGHTVLLPVSSAEAAFAAVEMHHPQVVFMAIHLQEALEGLTVGDVIETTEGIPVIYLSDDTPAELTAHTRGALPRFCLTTPLAEDALSQTLARALPYGTRQRTLAALKHQIAESRQQSAALQARVKELSQRTDERRDTTLRPTSTEDPEPPRGTSHRSTMGVLVVDDEDAVRTMLRDMLQQAGYAVAEAASGLDAVDRYRAAPTDVVILDLLMPGQSGLGTIQELRRHDPAVKIIAISGGGPSGAIDLLPLAEAYGAQRTLHKPFPIEALIEAVAAVVRE